MTLIEKTVGRNKTNDVIIDSSYVSGNHAILKLIDEYTIEITDLNSKNGTWVNGQKKSGTFRVRIIDQVEFANEHVDLKGIFKLKTTIAEGLDYTKEFEELRIVDEKYQKLKSDIDTKYTIQVLAVRGIAIIIAYYIIYYELPINKEDQAIKMGLIALFGLFSSQINFGKKRKELELDKLEEEKVKEFRCPKCGTPLLNRWKTYKLNNKNCSNQTCKAIFFKD